LLFVGRIEDDSYLEKHENCLVPFSRRKSSPKRKDSHHRSPRRRSHSRERSWDRRDYRKDYRRDRSHDRSRDYNRNHNKHHSRDGRKDLSYHEDGGHRDCDRRRSGSSHIRRSSKEHNDRNQYSPKVIEDLSGIQFLFKKRVVKELKWEKSFWKFSSSDWWDNLVSPEWIEYKTKKKKDENKG